MSLYLEVTNHSSSSASTRKRTHPEATFTSSARSPIEVAGAASLENTFEGLSNACGLEMSHSTTSEISCATSVHSPEVSNTYTYPETEGKYFIQMKIYKFADALTAPPEKLRTKALQDMKFVVREQAEDLITRHSLELIQAVHQHSRVHPKSVHSVKSRLTTW